MKLFFSVLIAVIISVILFCFVMWPPLWFGFFAFIGFAILVGMIYLGLTGRLFE